MNMLQTPVASGAWGIAQKQCPANPDRMSGLLVFVVAVSTVGALGGFPGRAHGEEPRERGQPAEGRLRVRVAPGRLTVSGVTTATNGSIVRLTLERAGARV